jgi:hypothetical protein
MSTLDRSTRSWGPMPALPEGLWKKFEEPSLRNVEELIKNLEIAVSNGWMGVAAEISEFLEVVASDLLDANPPLRLEVEIERLKRFAYMGFTEATKSAGERVLGFIEIYKDELDSDDKLVWESVAVTAPAWFIENPKELIEVIERCRKIDEQFPQAASLRNLCASFWFAIQGRYDALSGNVTGCRRNFKQATDLARKDNLQTPLAHLIIHYADSLAILNQWEEAARLANTFLLTANNIPQKLFRSHLLLRAIILLLEAPENIVPLDEFKYDAFRYHILLYATGLAPSQTIYPLLEKARKIIDKKSAGLDIDYLDWREELYRQIKRLGSDDFERLIKFVYESLDYTVHDLPERFQAFDLIAVSNSSDQTQATVGIQVKANIVEAVGSKMIPEDVAFEDAKELMKKKYAISSLSEVYWYTIKKIDIDAERRLRLRVKREFQCEVRTVDLDQLVNILLDKPDILRRIVFSSEWKTTSVKTSPISLQEHGKPNNKSRRKRR